MKKAIAVILVVWVAFSLVAASRPPRPGSLAGSPQKVLESSVSFRVKNAEIQVKGDFKSMETFLEFNKNHPEQSKFKTSIDVNSIHTGIRLRDKHLKGKFYFNAAQFPTIDVEVLKVKPLGEGYYNGLFKIRIKGVEKDQEVPFMVSQMSDHQIFSTKFLLNRRDFSIGGRSWTMSENIEVTAWFKTSL